jgi:carbamoyl-phosphate synthase/aspartate carbamoyltransferase/dihydroorotase
MTRTITIPGMVDPHVHLRGMEWDYKADFATETTAALAGGYWAIFDMPNTPPETINAAALDRKLTDMGRAAVCDWGVYFGASQADNTAEYAEIIDPVCGLKIYNNATTGSLLIADQALRDRVYAAWPPQRVIAVHAEGQTVADILALVRQYRTWTHFCHISTAEEIDLLRAAKIEGLPVSVGVTPHHLYLTETDVGHLGSLGRMKPELKPQADQDVLWSGIADGTVDAVESDHAPHTLEEKNSATPPSGVPGLETTLPLMCTALRDGRITEAQLIDLLALDAQRIFKLAPGANTYTVVDLDAVYEIKRANLRTKCGWSPFEGMQVVGAVREVWIRGKKVFDGETVLVTPGFGRNLFGGNA